MEDWLPVKVRLKVGENEAVLAIIDAIKRLNWYYLEANLTRGQIDRIFGQIQYLQKELITRQNLHAQAARKAKEYEEITTYSSGEI